MGVSDTHRTDLQNASGWYAVLPPPAAARRLKGERKADWVVVGAGVTGLAAARRLGELAPDARILLLENYRIGYGASGRNSGFIIDTPHLSETFDDETNRRISRVVLAGMDDLERLVRALDIDCEWSPSGHLSAIVQSKRIGKLHALRRTLDAVGETYEWLDNDALEKVLGTRHYHAAVRTPRTVLVNPAALCRGLGASLPANVEVCEESPVLRVQTGSPVRIECAEGSVSAANVLLTTNAFIARLGLLRRKVFPLIECASLSRPLTDLEQSEMGGVSDWGITGFATMRRTASNRILVRHGTYYSSDFRVDQAMRQRLQAAHLEGVRRRYPALGKLSFEHTWAGVFCMTRDGSSHFGQIEPGIFVSLGYSGVGMPRGTASGRLLAEYAMGSESDLIRDVQALSGPPALPPEPFLGAGVRARLAWHRWSNRAEW